MQGESSEPVTVKSTMSFFKLRALIETKENESVIKLVTNEPHYLLNDSTNTPTIIQPFFRFNVMHWTVCCKNTDLVRSLLNLLTDISFLSKAYVSVNRKFLEEKSFFLLDAFLNTPSKKEETPLHIAVKNGLVDIVEIFVSYSQCNTQLRNSLNETPIDMARRYSEDYGDLDYQKIIILLNDPFYVPILRLRDENLPVIGEPFKKKCPKYNKLGPISPEPEVHAYAGPMTIQDAQSFYKKLKTPPRLTARELNDNKCSKKKNDFLLRYSEKGMERIGSDLARKSNVDWNEYWPFLDSFVDLTSRNGLKVLENFFEGKKALIVSVISPKSSPCPSRSTSPSPISTPLTKTNTNLDEDDDEDNGDRELKTSCFANRTIQDITFKKWKKFPYSCFEIISTYLANGLMSILKQYHSSSEIILSGLEEFQNLKSQSEFLNDENISQIHYRASTRILHDFTNEDKLTAECFLRQLDKISNIDKFTKCTLTCVFENMLQRYRCPTNVDPVANISDTGDRSEDELKELFYNRTCSCPISKNNNCDILVNQNCLDSNSSVFDGYDNSDSDGSDNENIEYYSAQSEDSSLSSTTAEAEVNVDAEAATEAAQSWSSSASTCDEFEDALDDNYTLFIEDIVPRKTDFLVFAALESIEIDPEQYPNVATWKSVIKSYTKEERKKWPTAKFENHVLSQSLNDSWKRIIGQYTPTKTHSNPSNNISLNC